MAPRCRLKEDLRLEHCVECPATSATSEWEYDTSFCGQFLDEQGKQGTASYLRYSTIANLKPIENFVTPDDLEAKVAALETKLHYLLSEKLPAGTAHAVQLMKSYTPLYTTMAKAGDKCEECEEQKLDELQTGKSYIIEEKKSENYGGH